MEPFTKMTGLVLPLDRTNVNTDEITPARFLKSIRRSGFENALFANWRYIGNTMEPNPDFVLNQPRYQGVTILLAGDNFGCGSSREHAPWALRDYGFRCLIAPSFADIFYNNCFNNSILPVTLDEVHCQRTLRGSGGQRGLPIVSRPGGPDSNHSRRARAALRHRSFSEKRAAAGPRQHRLDALALRRNRGLRRAPQKRSPLGILCIISC